MIKGIKSIKDGKIVVEVIYNKYGHDFKFVKEYDDIPENRAKLCISRQELLVKEMLKFGANCDPLLEELKSSQTMQFDNCVVRFDKNYESKKILQYA